MAVVLLLMGLSLLVHRGECSPADADRGCKQWEKNGQLVCCSSCHPGNHVVTECGLKPKDLCTPCEPGTFTVNLRDDRCTRCTQCINPQVEVKKCTATSDTVCSCKEGLLCGDDVCSFCVEKCKGGQEPTEDRSCRPCPHGTFNNQSHQKCKPWRKSCPYPHQVIVAKGDAFSDIKCENISVKPATIPGPKDISPEEQTATVYIIVVICMVFIALLGFIIIKMALNIRLKQKKPKKADKKAPIIRTPTDEPRTLIAVECSFHEAQQEQGNSSESLIP